MQACRVGSECKQVHTHVDCDVIYCVFVSPLAPDNNIGPKGAKAAVERQLARLETFAILYGTCCRHGTSFCVIFPLKSPLNNDCMCTHSEKVLGENCINRLRETITKGLTTLDLSGACPRE